MAEETMAPAEKEKRSDPKDRNGLAIVLLDERTKYLEAMLAGEVERLENCIGSLEKSSLLQDNINKERFESHNRFRDQIEGERRELVRKEELGRVEREMSQRFDAYRKELAIELKARDEKICQVEDKAEKTENKYASTDGFVKALLVVFSLAGVGLAVLEIINH